MNKKVLFFSTLILATLFLFSSVVFAQVNDDFIELEQDIDQLAGYMGHSINYNLEGRINFRRHAGHFCNTGAEMKQVITGEGTITKESAIIMQEGFLTVMDDQDFTTAEDAVQNLVVTTSIKLCTPPKYVYGDGEVPVEWQTVRDAFIPVTYDGETAPDFSDRDMADDWDALTDQIWAVRVEANPGATGHLYTDFDAAFGHGAAERGDITRIGDFFSISQRSGTSDGIHQRYIDISHPRRHAYLFEDYSVTGSSSVRESLRLRNLSRTFGEATDWYSLF